MADKEIKITAKYDGKSAEVDAKKSLGKIQKTTGDVAKKSGLMVDENMGRSMSQFNEKTEKGRQLMTAFGGSLGKVGGQATYYAGTLSYVVGRFKGIELAAMVTIGALVAAGAALYDLAVGPVNRLLEDTKKLREESDKLADSLLDMADDAIAAAAKVSKFSLKAHEATMKRVDLEIKLGYLMEERARYKGVQQDDIAWAGGLAARLKELDTEINKTKISMHGLVFAEKKLAEAEAVEEKSKRNRKGRGGKKKDPYRMGTADMDAMLATRQKYEDELSKKLQKAEDHRQKQRQGLQDQEAKDQESHMWRMINLKEKEEKEKTRIAEEEAKLREKQQDETIRNSIALFEEVGNLMVQGEEGRKAIRIAAIIATAAYEAAIEVAAGWAAVGTGNFIGAGAHFTAAALYAAVAAGQVASEASGGGGRGSTSERTDRQGGRGESPWKDEKRETTIVVNLGGREVGRAIHESYESHEDRLHPNRARSRVGY